jgi:sorting nexin-1/2
MVVRWPGCFVPPLPPKKVIGNTSNSFVEERCLGLNSFLKNLAQLKHLWYCNEFQTFLRGNGEMEKVRVFLVS